MLRVPSTKWHFFLCLLVKKEDVLFGRYEFSAILKSMVFKLYVRKLTCIGLLSHSDLLSKDVIEISIDICAIYSRFHKRKYHLSIDLLYMRPFFVYRGLQWGILYHVEKK